MLDTFKMMYHAGELWPPPPQLQKMFETNGIDELHIRISNWKILSYILVVGLGRESVSLLAKYNYHVYTAETPSFFVTSDNPVALYHGDYHEIRPYGVGLATDGVEVTL